jgi:hypothetical protein
VLRWLLGKKQALLGSNGRPKRLRLSVGVLVCVVSWLNVGTGFVYVLLYPLPHNLQPTHYRPIAYRTVAAANR